MAYLQITQRRHLGQGRDALKVKSQGALNSICPYFTMFPLNFPLRTLRRHAGGRELVLDPFSGRGTTNYAARLLGIPSVGIDSSPVAAALTQAKLANTTPAAIVRTAEAILGDDSLEFEIPRGDFWTLAYDQDVLRGLVRLRGALLMDCNSHARRGLRGVVLGALHGPRTKGAPSYFSNQAQRTYAPKPGYAVKYWRGHGLHPPKVDLLELVGTRARRYYGDERQAWGRAILGDSRDPATYGLLADSPVRWIITSPPYYGMRTYIPDQWIRHWFVGGPEQVDYSAASQVSHRSPTEFVAQLRSVWDNVGTVASADADLVVRFGSIGDRDAASLDLLKESFRGSAWYLTTIRSAGSADIGKRQADHFFVRSRAPLDEYDAWARLR